MTQTQAPRARNAAKKRMTSKPVIGSFRSGRFIAVIPSQSNGALAALLTRSRVLRLVPGALVSASLSAVTLVMAHHLAFWSWAVAYEATANSITNGIPAFPSLTWLSWFGAAMIRPGRPKSLTAGVVRRVPGSNTVLVEDTHVANGTTTGCSENHGAATSGI
jgi:hypothetical protein